MRVLILGDQASRAALVLALAHSIEKILILDDGRNKNMMRLGEEPNADILYKLHRESKLSDLSCMKAEPLWRQNQEGVRGRKGKMKYRRN